MIIGYTTGVFDLFHLGHLNILRNSRAMCDRLIVGVTSDELVIESKNKIPVIPFDQRIEIVRNIKCVDVAIKQDTMNKWEAWEKVRFDIMFVGDDWFESDKWKELDGRFKEVGVRIVYFPYTKTVSTTKVNKILELRRETPEQNKLPQQ
ncbi:MAG: glycerol-3-phosphate cytidylyltransferase [Puniceicoccaceae bacterium]|nr:MAG: glycerol-3-phosphate cytidylyltransferase [Puniceicoccaceae bacterium]